MALKREARESDALPVSQALSTFLADTRSACETEQEQLPTADVDTAPLDDFFQRTLTAWS